MPLSIGVAIKKSVSCCDGNCADRYVDTHLTVENPEDLKS